MNVPPKDQLHGIVRFDPPLSGEENMAIDEGLLQSLAVDSPATLRIYRWEKPTLSLGHFQKEDDIPHGVPWASIPRVRRRTGGGAIVHDHEWTYSLAIPNIPSLGLKGHSESIYRAVHLSIVDALRDLGWDAGLSEECSCPLSETVQTPEPFLCFMRRSPVDVVIGKHKIVGSAQRRGRGGLLQHGSLVMRRSSVAAELPGLIDLPRNLVSDNGLHLNDRVFNRPSSIETNIDLSRESVRNDLEVDSLIGMHFGNWLAERVMIGLEKVFTCRWEPFTADVSA